MRRRRSSLTVTAVLACALAGCAALAGCGAGASLPGGHTIAVPTSVVSPSVSIPGLPDLDLSKTDPASAKHAVCTATGYWLKADSATKKAVRPAVDRVVDHYRASADPATRELARAAGQLLTADGQSGPAKQTAWNRLCGVG
jgi:hypothetical protein